MPHEEKIRTEKVEEKIKKEIEEEETETEKTTRQSIAGMMQQLEEMLKSGAWLFVVSLISILIE